VSIDGTVHSLEWTRAALLAGIVGCGTRATTAEEEVLVRRVLEEPLARLFVLAGQRLLYEPLADGWGRPVTKLYRPEGHQEDVPYAVLAHVLPHGDLVDLGRLHAPLAWLDAPPQLPGENPPTMMPPVSQALWAGSRGIDAGPWLLSHLHLVVEHLAALQDQCTASDGGPVAPCYRFVRARRTCERSLGLVLGQLRRYGGSALMIALRLSGADRLLATVRP
jgi:hypothetical protein